MNYTVQEIELNGVPRLGITLEEYPGHQFVVGAVEFLEVDGECKLKYNYNMVDNPAPMPKERFERAVGDFILYYFQHQNEHPVTYTGGT